jgi:hypothetical protein
MSLRLVRRHDRSATNTSYARSPYVASGVPKTCLQSSIFDAAVAFTTDVVQRASALALKTDSA